MSQNNTRPWVRDVMVIAIATLSAVAVARVRQGPRGLPGPRGRDASSLHGMPLGLDPELQSVFVGSWASHNGKGGHQG